jgi:hypothetical protein
MSKNKYKLKNNADKKELLNALEELRNFSQNEIPFKHITQIAALAGIEYLLKENRARGSLERFRHPLLNYYRGYNGYVGVHVIHKGGDQVLVRKLDYRHYIYPIFKMIIEETLKRNKNVTKKKSFILSGI